MIFRQGVTASDLASVRELLGDLNVVWRYDTDTERWEVLRWPSDEAREPVAVEDPERGWVKV